MNMVTISSFKNKYYLTQSVIESECQKFSLLYKFNFCLGFTPKNFVALLFSQ